MGPAAGASEAPLENRRPILLQAPQHFFSFLSFQAAVEHQISQASSFRGHHIRPQNSGKVLEQQFGSCARNDQVMFRTEFGQDRRCQVRPGFVWNAIPRSKFGSDQVHQKRFGYQFTTKPLSCEARQFAFEQLARWPFRNLFQKLNRLRAFVIGQMLTAERNQFFFARLRAVFEHDEGFDFFAK